MNTLTVAQTIKEQIGHQAFFMMGAKNLVGDVNSLMFKIGRNSAGVTHIKVRLDASDTYTVQFVRIRNIKFQPDIKFIKEVSDIYADGLHQLIESTTGLRLSLGMCK